MNTDTLEPEPITTGRTEVATAASTALDLERIDLKKLALARFGDWRGALAATTANLNTLALDLSTAAKCKEARSLRQRLIGEPLTDARKIAADTKSKMAATSKAVGAELETIEAEYDKADGLILPKIVAREQEIEAERQEKARIEAARVQAHKDRMATIGAYLTACQAPGMTSERIAKGIAMLAAATFDATWEEFQVPAANLQCETLEAMRVLHAQALGRELEAARQHEIRLENERQAKVLAEERARIDAETAALRKRAAEVEAAERRQREADEAEQRRQRDQFLRDNPPAQLQQTLEAAAPAAVWTDEDPDAATKLPTTEVVERTDPQEAEVLATASAPEPHEFSLGDLSAWLGLTVNLVFVERMGIKPHAVPGNAARRLTKTQRREFRAALLRHVEGLQA